VKNVSWWGNREREDGHNPSSTGNSLGGCRRRSTTPATPPPCFLPLASTPRSPPTFPPPPSKHPVPAAAPLDSPPKIDGAVLFACEEGRGLHGGRGEVPGFHLLAKPVPARRWRTIMEVADAGRRNERRRRRVIRWSRTSAALELLRRRSFPVFLVDDELDRTSLHCRCSCVRQDRFGVQLSSPRVQWRDAHVAQVAGAHAGCREGVPGLSAAAW
jgi:hypothetical protein